MYDRVRIMLNLEWLLITCNVQGHKNTSDTFSFIERKQNMPNWIKLSKQKWLLMCLFMSMKCQDQSEGYRHASYSLSWYNN